jgi:hypothetical protein
LAYIYKSDENSLNSAPECFKVLFLTFSVIFDSDVKTASCVEYHGSSYIPRCVRRSLPPDSDYAECGIHTSLQLPAAAVTVVEVAGCRTIYRWHRPGAAGC